MQAPKNITYIYLRGLAPLLCAVFLLLLVTDRAGANTEDEKKRVLVGADPWCPYNCDPNSDMPGYLIEIGTLVYARAGYDLHYVVMPWKRALTETQLGNLDAAVGATEANGMGLLIGQPLGFDESVFVVRKGEAFCYSGVESIASKHVGVLANYGYDSGGPLDTYLSGSEAVTKVFSENGLTRLFDLLLRHRIDTFLGNREVVSMTQYQLKLGKSVELVETGAVHPIYYGFQPTPRGEKLSKILDEGVQALVENGQLNGVLEKYGVKSFTNYRDALPDCLD